MGSAASAVAGNRLRAFPGRTSTRTGSVGSLASRYYGTVRTAHRAGPRLARPTRPRSTDGRLSIRSGCGCGCGGEAGGHSRRSAGRLGKRGDPVRQCLVDRGLVGQRGAELASIGFGEVQDVLFDDDRSRAVERRPEYE